MRDDPYGEPNGDYGASVFLGFTGSYSDSTTAESFVDAFIFNDLTNGYTSGPDYTCSPYYDTGTETVWLLHVCFHRNHKDENHRD